MKLLESWVQNPLAAAVGWTLLHSLWEGALIAALLAAALLMIRSSRARYTAGCVAMLVMVGACGFTLIWVMPEAANGMRTIARTVFPAWAVQNGVYTGSAWNPNLSAVVPWLAPLWIAGVWIFYAGHVAGWLSVCRLRRRGVCCAPERWQKELARLSSCLQLSRPILLLESCLAETPMVIGHFRPFLLMPVGLLAGLPAAQIEAILLHELAHIGRRDYLVNVLQRLLEGLFFYHPAVWWISRIIRAERENCCDDVAVAMSGNAHEYAIALAALEQNRWTGREAAVAATGGNLVKRIRRLLYPKGPNGVWTALLAGLIVIATSTLAVAAWQSDPPQQGSTVAQAAGPREGSAFARWLNEDVVYIINDAERAAFEKLTTDEEREKFVEQFWLRRDPTPGTAENEFKEEHYRRIGFANGHFRTASGRAGWQTDRGHMYILYGPPDEIDSHPSGTPKIPHGVESWMYHHVEGIGDNVSLTFIDQTGTGDYRLAPENAR